jgi:hypothetical protein
MIRKLNESYSDINSENVWDAYDIAEETLGSSELALSLAKAMGTEELSTLLGYIFQDWDIPFGDNSYDEDEYFEEDDYVEESAPRKSSRKMRRVDEDTNWNQPTPTAKNVVRKALKDNGIQLMSEYNDEEQSKRDGKTGIRVKRVFTTDLSAEDMYDEKPEALTKAVKDIKGKLGKEYTVLAMPNSDDNWEISISKITLESLRRNRSSRKFRR